MDIQPKNLDEVVDLLINEIERQKVTEEVKNEGIPHHGAGTSIRNALGLWWNDINKRFDKDPTDKPPLIQWFNERDIFMGDDLSMIITNAVQAKLKEEEYNVEDDIQIIKDHWERYGFKNGIYNPFNKIR